MDNQHPFRSNLSATGNTVTIIAVLLAYGVTLAAYLDSLNSPFGPPFSLAALLLAIILGGIYLWWLTRGTAALRPIFGQNTLAAFFIIAILLMLTIVFLLRGGGGVWLLAMPLVAMAVTDLPPRGRWIVYGIVMTAVTLPVYLLSGSWQSTLLAVVSYGAAVVFVVAFAHLTQQAELAQKQSEMLAGELELVNRQLAAYAVQAEELATTQERNRLAREIHDNLGHYLTVINVQIQAAQMLMDKDPHRSALALEKAQQLTQDGLSAVRQSVSALRESPLGGRPLVEAIGLLIAEIRASGIVGMTEVVGDVRHLDPRVELTLYRSVQEALTNTRKHARASRVDLTLDYSDPAAVALTVADNGIGAAELEGEDRFGLLGLRERVRQLGGTMSIETTPGSGFQLYMSLPSDAARLATGEGAADGLAIEGSP